MKRLPAVLLVLLVTAGCLFGCLPTERHYTIDYYTHSAAEAQARPRTVGAGLNAPVDRAVVTGAGTAGTVTVPTGQYVLSCSAAATATNATLTVTPCGPNLTGCVAQPAIPIPANYSYAYSPQGAANAVADTSTLVFANTIAYACLGWIYTP